MELITRAIVADTTDLVEIQEAALQENVAVQAVDQHGFLDPVSVTLTLIGSSLAVSTVAYLVEQRKGGQVFDLRKDALRPAYRSRDIAYGLVQIIASDGTVRVEVKEPRGALGQVLDTLRLVLQDMTGATVDPIAEAVGHAVGDMANIAKQ